MSVADDETLEELATVDRPALVSLAVRFGRTRLIDNVTLSPAVPYSLTRVRRSLTEFIRSEHSISRTSLSAPQGVEPPN